MPWNRSNTTNAASLDCAGSGLSAATNTRPPRLHSEVATGMVARQHKPWRRWPRLMLRMGQQRLISGFRGLGDHHGAAMVIARHGKTRCDVVAQERDFGAMGAIR